MMTSAQEKAGVLSPPDTPERQQDESHQQTHDSGKEDARQQENPRQDEGSEQQTEAGSREGEHGDSQAPLKEGPDKQESKAGQEPSPEPSSASGPQQEQVALPSPPQSLSKRRPGPSSRRPTPQAEDSETSLVRYTPRSSSSALSASGNKDDNDDDVEVIPRDPRSFPQQLRSPHLPPPTPPFRGFTRDRHRGKQHEYDDATETETDASSTYTQSRRRDLRRDLARRPPRRERRGPSRYEEYADDEDDEFGYSSSHDPRQGPTHGPWPQVRRNSRTGSGGGYAQSPVERRRDGGYPPQGQNQSARPSLRGGTGSGMVPYRQRRAETSLRDEYSYDDESSGALVLADPSSKKALRRERSVRKPERSARPNREVAGYSETRATGAKLRVQMNLNLEVEITLKAKIQGGIEFAML